MQAGPPQRPGPPERGATEGSTLSAFRQNRAAGEVTPEVSPLDQFIYRGRLLSKELKQERVGSRSPAYGPNRVEQGPPSRRGTPVVAAAGIREEGEYQHPLYEPSNPQNVTPRLPDGRPMQMFPRFSTAISEDGGDRDSIISTTTASDRDSTIMGGFSFGFDRSMPDLHQSPPSQPVTCQTPTPRDSVRPMIANAEEDVQGPSGPQHVHIGASAPRDSIRPTIETADFEVRPFGIPTTTIIAPSPRVPIRSPINEDYRMDSQPRRGSPDTPEGYNRSRSQPAVQNRRPPQRQGSGTDLPLRNDGIHRKKSYPRKDSNTPSPMNGPLQRQGSANSERFGPLQRHGSGNSERLLPFRQPSAGSERRFPPRQDSVGSHRGPSRQGSGDSVQRELPFRQNSLEGQTYQRNSPSPQPPSMLPMLSNIRAASPEAMDRDSRSVYSPQPSPMTPMSNRTEIGRSPSAASDVNSIYSIGGTLQPKPSYNFSRPRPSMDSQRPSIDLGGIQAPSYQDLTPAQIEALPTPTVFNPPERKLDGVGGPAPSYVYSKFALPRGRSVDRNSVVFQDFPTIESLYEQVTSAGRPLTAPSDQAGARPPRSPAPPSPAPPRTPQPPPKGPFERPEQSPQTALTVAHPPTLAKPRPHLGPVDVRTPGTSQSNISQTTITPAPRSPNTPVPAASISPDEHLEMGIDLHEKGSLQESTYHLRCAAHGGHPTGMLLYALACRHGWGMRPNQKEGVNWLKKVTQIASSEVADVEKGNTSTGAGFIQKQAHRAQFALSIYELGVSHLNGWGTEMDKGLALNCFEIAGTWGDPDALSEAGFCYANGVGTKKDLKKAAKFYRMAEAKGVNMVGSSWIWKDKYLDDEDREVKNKKHGKAPASDSKKEGGLFSRKKSTA